MKSLMTKVIDRPKNVLLITQFSSSTLTGCCDLKPQFGHDPLWSQMPLRRRHFVHAIIANSCPKQVSANACMYSTSPLPRIAGTLMPNRDNALCETKSFLANITTCLNKCPRNVLTAKPLPRRYWVFWHLWIYEERIGWSIFRSRIRVSHCYHVLASMHEEARFFISHQNKVKTNMHLLITKAQNAFMCILPKASIFVRNNKRVRHL